VLQISTKILNNH